MSYWEWNPALNLDIDVIDNQHRRIVDYINLLDVAIINKDRQKMGEVIMELMNYTITHFAFEESLMEKAGYPISEAHKLVHEAFTTHIKNYQKRFEAGEDVSRQLMSELQIWLTNHIKRDDLDYTPYVRKVLKKSWLNGLLQKYFN